MKNNKNAKRTPRNRNEKRRLLLQKKTTKDSGAKLAVPADGMLTKMQTINKRALAIVLAIVMVLGLLPVGWLSLRGKADEDDGNLKSVTLQVVANGTRLPKPVTIEPGVVAENVKNVSIDGLPDGAEFVKAVLIDADDVETEVKSVATYKSATYYSLNEDSDFGTALAQGEEIVLVYSTKYWITTVGDGNGSYEWNAHKENGKDFIWSEEDLEIKKITPNEYYSINSINYKSGSSQDTLTVTNSAVTIPHNVYKGDIVINFPFTKVSGYKINDISYAKGLGNGGLADTIGKTTLTSGEYSNYFKTRNPPSVASWDGTQYTKEFYIYSNSSSGGSNFQLNMLRINGEEFEVSDVDRDGGISKTLSDGTAVKVELIPNQKGMYWLDNKPDAVLVHDRDYNWSRSGGNYLAGSARKNRTVYKVTATNVHSDLNVEYNFKEKANRELIIKGLNGITQTAHAKEKLGNGPSYEYYFETSSNDSNVYKAYYREVVGVPSANLYLYKVKPGYNPYTVTSELYYDGEYVANGIVSGGGVGRPEEAIKNANAGITSSDSSNLAQYRMFDSQWRKWGGYYGQVVPIENDTNRYNGSDTSGSLFKGTPFVLTEIGEQYGEDPSTPLWYGIALQENQAYNQQLYLNAHPYQFKIELDTDGGTLADTDDYKNDNGLVIEQNSHSIEDPKTYLPTNEPTKEGYIFQYWELQKLDKDGNYVSIDAYDEAYQYQKADLFTITGDTLSLINGNVKNDNQRIRFKAVWAEPSESAKTTVFTEIYVQTLGNDFDIERGGKKYKRTHYSEETQMPGWVVLMNEYAPDHSKYYEKRSGKYEENETEYRYTKLVTESKLPGDSSYPESNTLRIYYDLRVVSLSVKKEVKGKPKTTEFEISIKLTPDDNEDAVITKEQAKALMALSDNGTLTEDGNDLVYTKTFHKGDVLTFSNIPYGWSYEVSEAGPVPDESKNIKADDFTTTIYPAASGKLTKDANVVVSNKGKNPGIETEKTLTSTGNDTYQLDLNAWATGESLTQMLEDTTALDIAIVVDQSGSMNETDVGTIKVPAKEPSDSNKAKTKWTVSEATSKTYYAYDKTDDKYYPVTAKSGPTYQSAGNSFAVSEHFRESHLTVFGTRYYYGVQSDLYYYDANKVMHPVFFNTRSSGAFGEGGMAYYVTLYYFYNPSQTSVPNVTEHDTIRREDSDFAASIGNVVSLLGSASEWKYAWTNPSIWPIPSDTSGTYNGTLYRVDGNNNGIQYTRDNGEVVQLGKDAVFSTDKVYSGYLYEEREVTRAEALQLSLNEFVESVKDNAEAQGVDHRVSLIGFAGNEVPGYSTLNGTYNNSGSFVTNNSYDYVNTGLFVDGTYKSFGEITNLRKLEADEPDYINAHYYVYYNGSEWRPVLYDSSSKKWYIVKNSHREPANTVYVTRITSGTDNPSSNSYYFYEPEYAYLDNNGGVNYYQKALQTVNDDGTVNADLTKEIGMIGAYGPTYTSFGMDMATQVFRYNPISDGENRKRIVIVFSDGAPGVNSNSFDNGVAEESYADSRLLKTEYGADVYTVYLYGKNKSPNEQAQSFMQKLSSSYEYDLSPVYDLNPEKAYLYKDGTKTTSVTSTKQLYAKSPSGGWYVFDPETMEGSVYDSSYSPVAKTSLTLGETYYIYTSNGYEPFVYDYVWYDSAGYIAMPKTSEEDPDSSHRQFYELIATEVDTEDAYYYQEAQSAEALVETFEKITESLHLPTTTVTLDAANSFMHDVVTADFDLPMNGKNVDLTKFSAQVVPATAIDDDGKITWAEPGDDSITPFELTANNLEVIVNDDGTKTINVKNFNYGENYTTDGHLGSKLVVTIQGLTPAEGTIGTVDSNTDTSGVYWENDNDETYMVAEFDIPKATVEGLNANVKLNYGGFNKIEGQKFPVTIKLTKSDGETPYTGKFGNYTFSSDGTLQTMMGDGDTRFFSDIPQKAKMTVTVADPDNASVYYTYSVTGLDTVDASATPGEKELTVDITTSDALGGNASEGQFDADKQDTTREVKIDILDVRQSLTVTNKTTGSFADYGHEFLFDILITDAEGHEFDGIILDTNGREVEIHNGKIVQSDENDMTLKLANNQSRGFYIPPGFEVKVIDSDPSPYLLIDTETDTPTVVSISDDKATITASWDVEDTDNHPGRVTFIHYIEDIVPTGISEDTHNTNPLIWILIGVTFAGVFAFFFVEKRRRRMGEQ